MTETVYLVITSNGDGSNSIEFYCDPSSITHLERLADAGDDTYSSGDGLQVTKIKVPNLEEFACMQGPYFYWSDERLVLGENY